MMNFFLMKDYIGFGLIVFALIFILIGSFGLFKLPNLYSKAHAGGIIDSFACPIFFIGIAMCQNNIFIALKIIFVVLFLIMGCVFSSQAICAANFDNERSE